ncbi:hypothetical protein [Pseudomonas putida]|uniref:Uncharacterized protein n=1 Tax=Pseudomonas putida TaxID=303 RepID=A0A1Q9RAC4_PSEPU|nr:hypothetical protein [Pseudomonas putida]OLS64403.1 hypothetical protein PSEMO_06880 [Pseudomonas putida]
MSGPDALHQVFGVVLLAMAFSAFILFVRGYRPAGVSGLWYDLVLGFIALWLALWPELIHFAEAPRLASGLGLLLQIIATAAGCILGALLAKALRLLLLERRRPRGRR